ncbi:hypothetical protein [Kitasatospora sp. NPDC005856]|uniref:hypothetical protein n=1 Tax=Kitasatospora sp. NPDC005856 TaxID=3154566 RepID=UPI0033CB807B
MATLLLEHGGVAADDCSDRLWTPRESESGAEFDGLCSFGFRTDHELHHKR